MGGQDVVKVESVAAASSPPPFSWDGGESPVLTAADGVFGSPANVARRSQLEQRGPGPHPSWPGSGGCQQRTQLQPNRMSDQPFMFLVAQKAASKLSKNGAVGVRGDKVQECALKQEGHTENSKSTQVDSTNSK